MYQLSKILLICLCFTAAACTSSKNENEELETASTHELNDNPENSKPETTPPDPVVAPAPGSVQVQAEIIDFEATSKGYHCELKIVSVDKYGANTPPLAQGQIVKALIATGTLASAAAGEEAEKILSDGGTRALSLKYQQVPDAPGISALPWRIVLIR